jgi:hypothetical protein
VLATAMICAITYGIFYTWGHVKDAREKRERAAAEKIEKEKKDAAIAARWAELNAIQSQVCGSQFISATLYGMIHSPQGDYGDASRKFPDYGEIGCIPHQGTIQDMKEISPPSAAGCAVLLATIPAFTCMPPAPSASRFDVPLPSGHAVQSHPGPHEGHRRVKAKYDIDLMTTEFSSLKCGHVQMGDVATLLEEGEYGIKVRTSDGQVGWANATNFEVIQ